jgi:two-component system chemotaxis sensor kinase CheA
VNTSDYKDAFLTEAREYLSTLNNSLIQLEKDPRQTEAIKEIFRAAHTLKGMSATMGYEPMAHLTHQMESVLEPIRSETKKLTSTLVDALFTCLDQLETWVKTLSTQETIGEERLGSLVQLLKDSAAGEPSAAPKPLQPVPMVSQDKPSSLPAFDASKMDVPFEFFDSENEVLSQAKMGGFSVLKVSVELEPDCAFKEVRAFMVLRNINEVGEIVKSHPSPEDIEKGNFPNQFHLVVVTDRPIEKLKDTLSKVSEVKAVTIEAFQPTGLSRPAAERAVAGVFKTRASDKAVPGAPAGDRPFAVPTVRVQTTKLDKLMALVQELVIAKIRFEQIVLSNQI